MLEILVAHAVLAKMADDLPQLGVGDGLLADHAGEIDLLQNAGQHRVVFRKRRKGLVQQIADILMGGFVESGESRPGRYEQAFVQIVIFGQGLGLLW